MRRQDASWRPLTVAWVLVIACFVLKGTNAIIPTAKLDVSVDSSKALTLLMSQAGFGSRPRMHPQNNVVRDEIVMTGGNNDDDPYLCEELSDGDNGDESTDGGRTIVFVPRGGGCTFEHKAWNVQRRWGGNAVMVIYGTTASRYSRNETTGELIFPVDKHDYDCERREQWISTPFNELPSYDQDDKFDNDDGGQCERYLYTGQKRDDDNGGDGEWQVCCAWDLHVWLYEDDDLKQRRKELQVQPFYITMQEANDELFPLLENQSVELVAYSRYRPRYNLSAFLVWALGVFVAALAAYISASEYREYQSPTLPESQPEPPQTVVEAQTAGTAEGRELAHSTSGTRCRSRSPPKQDERRAAAATTPVPNTTLEMAPAASTTTLPLPRAHSEEPPPQQESLELNASHALGFVLLASCALLTLFFLKIYSIVKVMYAFGCAGAVTQVLFIPFYNRIADILSPLSSEPSSSFLDRPIACLLPVFGPVSPVELLAVISGYGLGVTWLIVSFRVDHPETMIFYWVTQDILGSCMCILFLSVMKLNSIRVASILLVVAFFYDIFFVFITPLLTKGGKSVMITVATSGGPPKADPSWCEKYPRDQDCQGGDPLPMLLTVPRLDDYLGGSSLLGLGDIVLPGLLLSFAARLDAAKRMIGRNARGGGPCSSSGRSKGCFPCCCFGTSSYFFYLVIAYGVGLCMANAAVYLMDMGQPALLYLVPCCLGTFVTLGWMRGELWELWAGPRVLRAADEMLMGGTGEMNPGDESMELGSAGSLSSSVGEEPLLS